MSIQTNNTSVLHIYSSVNAGGGMLFVKEIVQAMQSLDSFPHIALRPQSALKKNLSSNNTRQNLTEEQIHSLPLRNGLDIYSIWKLAKVIRHHNIQVIHAHTGRDYYIAFILAKLLRRKCVFHRHYYRVSKNLTTRFLFKNSDFIITVNEQLKSKYIQHVGVNESRIENLPNWYERPSSSIKKKPKKHKHFVISMAGNINSNKGQHIFIAAAKLVLATHPNCLFKIIGVNEKNANTDYYQSLLNRITSENLGDKITFQPWQTNIMEYYDNSDIWVVPSKNEAFGRVAIEAMSHEVPLIVSDVGGLKEIVEHGVTGYKYEPSNEKALAISIKNLLDNHSTRKLFAAQALQHTKKLYTQKTVLNKLYQIYQEVSLIKH